MMSAFMSASVAHGMRPRVSRHGLLLEDALWERHDEHLAGRLPKDVVDRRGEEPRLPPPPGRRAEDDEVGLASGGLFDDRLADRPSAHRHAQHLDAVFLAEQLRLLERL